jgi:hypothetical protein
MASTHNLDPVIAEAIEKIEAFILQTTGEAPTPEELSSALTRYFVLKEIADFIKMSRQEGE